MNIKNQIKVAVSLILNRDISKEEFKTFYTEIKEDRLKMDEFILSLYLSLEYMEKVDKYHYHLRFMHNARQKLIKYYLPEANTILDIGGANGSLIEFGYSHSYQKLIITDLPPEDRIEELKKVDLYKRWQDRPNIEILLTSMSDLNKIDDGTIDLVWAGEVLEHVDEAELIKSLIEIKRVLKVGGFFCFDTPNALLTRIHSPEALIHPEHKKEYNPQEIRKIMNDYFLIEEEVGIIPMPKTYKTKVFSYDEMSLSNSLSNDLDSCYLMYFKCKKNE